MNESMSKELKDLRKLLIAELKRLGCNALKTTSSSVRGFNNTTNYGYKLTNETDSKVRVQFYFGRMDSEGKCKQYCDKLCFELKSKGIPFEVVGVTDVLVSVPVVSDVVTENTVYSIVNKILEGADIRSALENIKESKFDTKIYLKDFIKLETKGGMFILVDATQQGYMGKPFDFVLIEADKNVLRERYGDYFVVGYEAYRNKMVVFVKP